MHSTCSPQLVVLDLFTRILLDYCANISVWRVFNISVCSILSTPPLPAACLICFIVGVLPVAHSVTSTTMQRSVSVNRYSSVPVLHVHGVSLISTLYLPKLILYQCTSDVSLTQLFSNPVDTGIFPWGKTGRAWCYLPSYRLLVHNVYLVLLPGQQISGVALVHFPCWSPLYLKVQTGYWTLASKVTAIVMNAFWWRGILRTHASFHRASFMQNKESAYTITVWVHCRQLFRWEEDTVKCRERGQYVAEARFRCNHALLLRKIECWSLSAVTPATTVSHTACRLQGTCDDLSVRRCCLHWLYIFVVFLLCLFKVLFCNKTFSVMIRCTANHLR
jgi:hypothetical protein